VIGTVVTAVMVGAGASVLFDFSVLEGLLPGAILAATGGAAVFALCAEFDCRVRLRRTLEGRVRTQRSSRGAARADRDRPDHQAALRGRQDLERRRRAEPSKAVCRS
jgi:hypothetical protein